MLFPELWQTDFSPSHPSYLLFPLRFAVPNVFFRFSPPHCIGYWLHLTSVTNRTLVNRWKLLSRDTWESRNERFLRKPNIDLNTPRKPPLVLQLRQGPWGTVNTVRTDDHTEVGAPPWSSPRGVRSTGVLQCWSCLDAPVWRPPSPPLSPGGEFSLFPVLEMIMIFLVTSEICIAVMGDKCINVGNP